MAGPDRGGARGRSGWRPVGGAVLAVVCVPLLVVLPELGLPLLYLALRLLATRFAWADAAITRLDAVVARVRAWFGRLPRAVRALVLLVLLALGVGVVYVLVAELV